MTLPSSGALSLNSIQGEFGGSNPIGLNEYYRGGSLVPNHSNTSSIPTSGTIDVQDFYGTSASSPLDLSFTFNMSPKTGIAQGKFVFQYVGYADSSIYGTQLSSISDNSVASGGSSGTIIQSDHEAASGYPNYTFTYNNAWRIKFNNSTIRDAIFTGRSGANFQGLGNEAWSTATNSITGSAINPGVGNGATTILWGRGLGSGTDATELARQNRFASWMNGRANQNTTVTFY